MTKKEEEWKYVDGYGTKYAISNHGRIWSTRYQKYITPHSYMGYPGVKLHNGMTKTFHIHRLVAMHFPNSHRSGGRNVVVHLDGDKDNFYFENLQWDTLSGAHKRSLGSDRIEHLKTASAIGVKKISRPVEVYLKGHNYTTGRFIGAFPSMYACARALGISETAVRNALSGKYVNQTYLFRFLSKDEE